MPSSVLNNRELFTSLVSKKNIIHSNLKQILQVRTSSYYSFPLLFIKNRTSIKKRNVVDAYLLLVLEATSPREKLDDVSWVVSTPGSPVPTSLHLLALKLKPSLAGLRASVHPLFTHHPFRF